MMPMPQMPPEDLQRYMADQEAQRAHHQAIQTWYDAQAARLETEHRERVIQFAAILCPGKGVCMVERPCPVHSTVHITLDGRVL